MDAKQARPGTKAIWFSTAGGGGSTTKRKLECEVVRVAGPKRCIVLIDGKERCVGLEQLDPVKDTNNG